MKIILIMLFIVSACSDSKFRKVEELDRFRILGVSTTQPEVAAGTMGIILQLYVSDTSGGGRVINGTVVACIDPGVALGAEVNCDHDPTRTSGNYQIDTINDADLGAGNLYTGLATDTFSVDIPAWALTGRSSRDQNNGVGYLVIFTFKVDGRSHQVFKKILVSNRAVKNTNPTVVATNLNDVAITTKPNDGDNLSLISNAAQSYTYIEVDGVTNTKTEELKVAWYLNKGEIDSPKSNAGEKISFKSARPSGTMVLVGVLRDDRGGIAFDRHVLP